MLCQKCGKNQGEGTFRCFSESGWVTMWLCPDCAREEEAIPCKGNGAPSLADLLPPAPEAPSSPGRVCRCGAREEEIRRTGKPGCAHCYETFRDLFAPLISKTQGDQPHQGQVPRSQEGQQNILRLRRQLQQAVEQEEYEKAALLRDALHQMESTPKEGNI